ncbi:MAG: hypothetical protein ABIS67_01510, partial [Candidatus Eisenbacteria bacterium]
FTALLVRDGNHTAAIIEHVAEIDARKLFLHSAYPSMFAYCVGEFHMSEDAAYVRIRAARTAREFPVLFEAVAKGRLHLSAVRLLKPHLTPETVDGLLAAAHKSKTEIERLLAALFPQPEVPTLVQVITSCSQRLTTPQLVPERVDDNWQLVPERVGDEPQLVPERVAVQPVDGHVNPRVSDATIYLKANVPFPLFRDEDVPVVGLNRVRPAILLAPHVANRRDVSFLLKWDILLRELSFKNCWAGG